MPRPQRPDVGCVQSGFRPAAGDAGDAGAFRAASVPPGPGRCGKRLHGARAPRWAPTRALGAHLGRFCGCRICTRMAKHLGRRRVTSPSSDQIVPTHHGEQACWVQRLHILTRYTVLKQALRPASVSQAHLDMRPARIETSQLAYRHTVTWHATVLFPTPPLPLSTSTTFLILFTPAAPSGGDTLIAFRANSTLSRYSRYDKRCTVHRYALVTSAVARSQSKYNATNSNDKQYI